MRVAIANARRHLRTCSGTVFSNKISTPYKRSDLSSVALKRSKSLKLRVTLRENSRGNLAVAQMLPIASHWSLIISGFCPLTFPKLPAMKYNSRRNKHWYTQCMGSIVNCSTISHHGRFLVKGISQKGEAGYFSLLLWCSKSVWARKLASVLRTSWSCTMYIFLRSQCSPVTVQMVHELSPPAFLVHLTSAKAGRSQAT